MGDRLPWKGTAVIVALAIVALVVAHLLAEPDRHVTPTQYTRWRAYCVAEADRTYLRGTAAWTADVNSCLVDIAKADARLDGR